MPITVTTLTSGTQAYDGSHSSVTTASISPSANKLILVCVANASPSGSLNAPTGNGLTYELVNSSAFSVAKISVFRAMGTPSAGAVTISSTAADGYEWAIFEIGGVAIGANGATAIVQSVGATGSGATGSVTLAAFSDVQNATFLAASAIGGTVPTGTPGTGFTELVDTGVTHTAAGFSQSIYTEWENANDTTADYTITGGSAWSAVGIELKFGGINVSLSNSRSSSFTVARSKGAKRTDTNSRSTSASAARSEGAKRSVSLTGNMSSSSLRVLTARRTETNSRSASGTLNRIMNAKRHPTNSRISDNALRFNFQKNRLPSNILSTAATLTRPFSLYYRTKSNSRSGSQAVIGLKATFKPISNNVSTTAAVVRSGSFHRTISQTKTTVGLLARKVTAIRAASSEFDFDTASVLRGLLSSRTANNSTATSGLVDWHIPTRIRVFGNSIATIAGLSRKKNAIRSLSRSGSITISVARRLSYVRLRSISIVGTFDLTRSHGLKKRLFNDRNSSSLLRKKLFRSLAAASALTPALTYRKGYFRFFTQVGSFDSSTERIITLAKTIWETKGFTARLQVFHGFVQTDLSPVLAGITSKVTGFGIFFRPSDPGYDDD